MPSVLAIATLVSCGVADEPDADATSSAVAALEIATVVTTAGACVGTPLSRLDLLVPAQCVEGAVAAYVTFRDREFRALAIREAHRLAIVSLREELPLAGEASLTRARQPLDRMTFAVVGPKVAWHDAEDFACTIVAGLGECISSRSYVGEPAEAELGFPLVVFRDGHATNELAGVLSDATGQNATYTIVDASIIEEINGQLASPLD